MFGFTTNPLLTHLNSLNSFGSMSWKAVPSEKMSHCISLVYRVASEETATSYCLQPCPSLQLFRAKRLFEVLHHLAHLLFVHHDPLDRILMTDELDASTKPKPRAVHHTAQKLVDLINNN